MPQSVIGSLRVLLGMDAGEFDREAKRASSRADKFGKSLQRALSFAAAGVAVKQLVSSTRQAAASLDAIAKTADKIGVSTKALQELRFAASQTGVETHTMELALQRFVRRTAEAAKGTGEAKAVLKQMGIQLRDNTGHLRSAEDLLGDVADKLMGVSDQGERVRIAFKLFDSEGVGFLNTLQNGSRGLDAMRKAARDAGIVIDEKVIRNAEKMNDRLDKAQQIIDAQLNTAFLELAPVIATAAEAFAELTKDVVDFIGQFKRIDELGTGTLEREIARLQNRVDSFADPTSWARLQQTAIKTFTGISESSQAAADLARLKALEAEKAWRDIEPVLDEIRPKVAAVRDIFGEITLNRNFVGQLEDAAVKAGRILGILKPEATDNTAGVTLPTKPREKPDLGALQRERFTALEDILTTETERINEEYQTRLEILDEAQQAELDTKLGYDKLRERAKADHERQLTEIEKRGAMRRKLIARQEALDRIQMGKQVADNLIGALENIFGESKATAIASTIVNTAESIMKTFALYGPTPVGYALAASMAALGATQIAKIASTSRKSGGSAGAATAATTGGQGTAAQGAPTGGTIVNVTLLGEPTRESTLRLIEQINDAVGDGATIRATG